MQSIPEIETSILDAAADAIVLIDDRGNIEFFNRAATELFGYAPDEILGQNVKRLMSEPVASQHDFYIRRYRETGVAHIIGTGRDVEGRHKDGRSIPLWLRVGEQRGSDGRSRFVGSMRDISEHRRIEAELRVSEARYRHTQILARIGYWAWVPGPDGNSARGICEYSREAANIFGASPADLAISISEYIERFVHPDDRADVMKLFAAANEGRAAFYDARYRIVCPDGDVRFVQEHGEHVLDERGNIKFFHGIVQDVTDHAILAETLRESEASLRRDHRLARLGHWLMKYGPDGRWQNAVTMDSPEFNEIVGLVPGEPALTVEEFVSRFVHPDDLPAYTQALDRLADPDIAGYVSEHRIRRPDGTIIFIHEIGESLFDRNGRLVSASGTIQDITEQRRTESTLRERENSLRQGARLGRFGTWVWDLTEDRCLVCSEEQAALFDMTVEEFMRERGSNRQIGADSPSEDKPAFDDMLTPEVGRTYDVDFRATTKSGELRYFREVGQTFLDDATGKLCSFGVTQDITESKSTEVELRRLVDELSRLAQVAEQANRAKSEFLATMSHELRTPLNAIIGFSELLLNYSHTVTSDKSQDYHEAILQSGKHLLNLINDILDLARVESGKLELAFENIALPTLISECAIYLEPSAQRRSISIHVDVPQIELSSDRRLLKQVLINALSNAVKFNKENGAIHVKATPNAQAVVIAIEDTGIGMDEHEVVRALEPFVQIESAYQRTREGTGLGLALVQRFTSLLGGKFEIRSVKGMGTTVLIELPIRSAG